MQENMFEKALSGMLLKGQLQCLLNLLIMKSVLTE
jgi:hypothetical protein